MQETIQSPPLTHRSGVRDISQDLGWLVRGVLDWRGFINGYRKALHRVEARVYNSSGRLLQVRRSKNLRTTVGTTWQSESFSGGLSGSLGYTGIATATSATSLTATGTPWSVNQWTNNVVVNLTTSPAWAVILSNTSSVLTLDQWYTFGSNTGASAATPSNTGAFAIMPGSGPAIWMALDSSGVTPNIAATVLGTEPTTLGMNRAFQPATFPSSGVIQYAHTWTYSGNAPLLINNVGMFNSGPGVAGTLILYTALSAPAGVSNPGDQMLVTWTINI
jgi:hypothetical protein